MECRGELYMTMARSSLALSFPASVTSLEYRVYPQLLTILLQMGSHKLSTKPSRRFSKSSSPGASATGTRNWVNVYGLTKLLYVQPKATPFSLVYGCEAVLPLEIQIPSLR